MRRFFALAIAAALLAMPLPAAADDAQKGQGPDLAGRWHDNRKDLTLDLTRCGDAWCGVIVARDGSCGFRGLQMAISPPAGGPGPVPKHVAYEGEFRYREGSELYKVFGFIANEAQDGAQLQIHGNPATMPPYARVMLLHLQMARQGAAQCRADRPVS